MQSIISWLQPELAQYTGLFINTIQPLDVLSNLHVSAKKFATKLRAAWRHPFKAVKRKRFRNSWKASGVGSQFVAADRAYRDIAFVEISRSLADFAKDEPEIALDPVFDNLPELIVSRSQPHAIWSRIFADLEADYDRLIFLPWLVRGGAELEAANIARAITENSVDESVLVVVTDHARVDAKDWWPADADFLVLSDYDKTLSHDERVRIVEMLIFAIRPKAVLNVNSRACWDAFAGRGKALANVTFLYSMLFCRAYDQRGRAAGYADTHFRTTLPFLTKVYIDNETFIRQLAADYRLPPPLRQRLQFLPQPVDPKILRRSFATASENRRMTVMWAGRIAAEKNIELLNAIVAHAPHIRFDVYGWGGDADMRQLLGSTRAVGNVVLKGEYLSESMLPTEKYAAYLFTSFVEGMPNILINMAARGMPIVATNVGGISELIDNRTGWLIDEINDPTPYIAALDEIWQNPDNVSSKVGGLLRNVNQRHSQAAYIAALQSLPSFVN